MPGRFGLRQVVLRGDVMPQGLPSQFAGGVRPRSPVRQPSGFEPPVHARLAHRDSPSRLCRCCPPCTKLTTRRRTSNEHLMPYSSSVHPICLLVIVGLAIIVGIARSLYLTTLAFERFYASVSPKAI